MEEKELCELMMEGLACLKKEVRSNTHILNSTRVSELERITRAQRMLSALYSEIKPKAKEKRVVKKTAKKVAKKKGTKRK